MIVELCRDESPSQTTKTLTALSLGSRCGSGEKAVLDLGGESEVRDFMTGAESLNQSYAIDATAQGRLLISELRWRLEAQLSLIVDAVPVWPRQRF